MLKTDYVIEEFFQCIKLTFEDYDLVTIYRPPGNINPIINQQVEDILYSLIIHNKPTVINGNFNFDYWKESNNLSVMLVKNGFTQIVKEPTTYYGKCLDHIYVKKLDFTYNLYYPYYTHHEAVRVVLKKLVCST